MKLNLCSLKTSEGRGFESSTAVYEKERKKHAMKTSSEEKFRYFFLKSIKIFRLSFC